MGGGDLLVMFLGLGATLGLVAMGGFLTGDE